LKAYLHKAQSLLQIGNLQSAIDVLAEAKTAFKQSEDPSVVKIRKLLSIAELVTRISF